jgi:hypothetical protein
MARYGDGFVGIVSEINQGNAGDFLA